MSRWLAIEIPAVTDSNQNCEKSSKNFNDVDNLRLRAAVRD